MSIENPSVIDGIGTDAVSGTTVLTVSDHLDWAEENSHLSALQSKVNAYLDFVSSGQIYEIRPEARGSQIRIDVIARIPPPASVNWFFDKVHEITLASGIGFTYKQIPDGY